MRTDTAQARIVVQSVVKDVLLGKRKCIQFCQPRLSSFQLQNLFPKKRRDPTLFWHQLSRPKKLKVNMWWTILWIVSSHNFSVIIVDIHELCSFRKLLWHWPQLTQLPQCLKIIKKVSFTLTKSKIFFTHGLQFVICYCYDFSVTQQLNTLLTQPLIY